MLVLKRNLLFRLYISMPLSFSLFLNTYIFLCSPIYIQEKDPLSRTNRRNIFNTFYGFLLIDFFFISLFRVCFCSSLILVVLQIQYLLLSLKKLEEKGGIINIPFLLGSGFMLCVLC